MPTLAKPARGHLASGLTATAPLPHARAPHATGPQDNAGAGDIYAHKLFAPKRSPGTISRAAILDRVLADPARRVVLLQGPAGHGKTTTLQQLKAACEERGTVTSWLTFDTADNDARRGFSHIHAALASLIGTLLPGDTADPDAQPDAYPDGGLWRSDRMADQLLRLPWPAAMFFDEFQTLTERSMLGFFRGLLDRLPEHVTIFIGSRAIPNIGMSRLVVNGQAIILGADDLRFSPGEAETFFADSADLAVRDDELRAIYARTEGWPAALQLFRLALVSPNVRRSLGSMADYRPAELAEYLIENVLDLQAPHLQSFLLRTSLLNRLSAPLCDAITGRAGSQEILLALERSGLFLRRLDHDSTWFKYHALFAYFLGEHLTAQAAGEAADIHRAAAAWYRGHGMYEEAMHHFIAEGDVASAADTMDLWASCLTAGGNLVTVESWYDRLPFAEVARRPGLVIKAAYALVFLRRHAKVAPLLAVLRALPSPGGGDTAIGPKVALAMAAICVDDVVQARAIIMGTRLQARRPSGFDAFELAAGGNLAAYCAIAEDDFERAHEHLVLAHSYGDTGGARFAGGYTCALMGSSLILQGQLGIGLEVLEAGLAKERMQLDNSLASAALAACHVWALYEANELDRAEALFAQYRDGIADAVLLDFLAVAYLPMARIHDARGRPARALETLAEAEQIGHANGWERLVRMVQWERVRRCLATGATDRAAALAARIARPTGWPVDWWVFSEEVGGEQLASIRFAIHTGSLDAAARALAHEAGRHRRRVSLQIKLHLLEALLQVRRSARGNAHRSLRRALQLAYPGRMIRIFIDEGAALMALCRDEHRATADDRAGAFAAERAFLEEILTAASDAGAGGPLVTPCAAPPALAALTDREREILIFLANGRSNRDMAERIFVSENTIKFHLKNIYSKLDVANRLQAVTLARQLGLVA